jgi:hypothetical protein
MLGLRRTSQSGGPQDRQIDAATGTTVGQLALDDHCRNRKDAKSLGALGYLAVSHVVNDHLARGASGAPDDLDCFMAGRASGTVHFDLSLCGHLFDPICLHAQPTSARCQTLRLGATSRVKREVARLHQRLATRPRCNHRCRRCGCGIPLL